MEYGPSAFIFGLAMLLLVLGYAFTRGRRMAPARIERKWIGKMLPLMEAAASVHAAAKREHMVIATVAEKAGGDADALAWFAQSIARVVPVYRMGSANAFEKLQRTAAIGPDPQSLYIQKRDYKTYASWARSMQ